MSQHFLQYALRQDLGKRKQQEDSIASVELSTNQLLIVLADGMGGHEAGERASEVAVQHFINSFQRLNEKLPDGAFRQSLDEANEAIAKEIESNRDAYEGMGTTILAVWCDGETLQWISVGDSPLYLFRNGEIQQLNEDHSMMPIIEHFIEIGALPSQAKSFHPQRNLLRSAVCGSEMHLVDLTEEPFPLQRNDVLLIASDGIQSIANSEIASIITAKIKHGPEAIANALIDKIQELDFENQDNSSLCVILV